MSEKEYWKCKKNCDRCRFCKEYGLCRNYENDVATHFFKERTKVNKLNKIINGWLADETLKIKVQVKG